MNIGKSFVLYTFVNLLFFFKLNVITIQTIYMILGATTCNIKYMYSNRVPDLALAVCKVAICDTVLHFEYFFILFQNAKFYHSISHSQ
jgi:hypothetical protein